MRTLLLATALSFPLTVFAQAQLNVDSATQLRIDQEQSGMQSAVQAMQQGQVSVPRVSAPKVKGSSDSGRVGTDLIPTLTPGQGVVKMQELMGAIKDPSGSSIEQEKLRAIETAMESARHTSSFAGLNEDILSSTISHTESWQQMAKEAYVAALPPRDRELGRSILLGDGTTNDFEGKVYVFVSRSMPMSLLKAYALDAAYSGATLVMKGIRRGDTIQDFVMEMVDDFNSADGKVLATTELNPNLFDMFDIKVVPTVVWTNRVGLDETGSGCQAPPELLMPYMDVEGPNETTMRVEKPTCIQLPESSYYKLAGALKMDYVLERFVQAGAPASLLNGYRHRIAERHQAVFDTSQPEPGNAMTPVQGDISLNQLPKRMLEEWDEDLKVMTVQRGPYGPAFGEGDDDPIYRQELLEQIRQGLGR